MLPPVWFQDAAARPVVELLRWFVRQLNALDQEQRQRKLTRKLTARHFPALFNYSRLDDIDFLKEAMAELSRPPYSVWHLSTTGAQRNEDELITLTFHYAAEPVLREWLNMPRVDPQQEAWIAAIDRQPIPIHAELLQALGYPGVYAPDSLLSALYELQIFLQQPDDHTFSWRRLSARFFFGDSKYLDSISRQQWLLALFPQLHSVVENRSLLLNVFLVEQPEGILLIENQDTFCWLMNISADIAPLQHLILVYSQGFMGSAQRSRDADAVQFMYQGKVENFREFQQHWLQHAGMELPMYFWGDLDYAGLSILKSLRQVFPSLTAWRPGYQPMLDALLNGAGHAPDLAGKIAQLMPAACGCDYADHLLLPGLQKTGRFIDQEWVDRRMLYP